MKKSMKNSVQPQILRIQMIGSRLLPVFSDFNNVLHISVYELEAGTKYKLVYKFMTGD